MNNFIPQPYGDTPSPKRSLADLDWIDPDQNRSKSAMYIESQERGVIWALEVKGLGVLVLRAGSDPETGRLDFRGVSQFTNAEVGLWS